MEETMTEQEHATLLSYLSAQRDHVLETLEGLDDEALRHPVLPSGWSCLGLIQHLTLDVERFWFSGIVAGEQTILDDLDTIPMPGSWIRMFPPSTFSTPTDRRSPVPMPSSPTFRWTLHRPFGHPVSSGIGDFTPCDR